MKENAISRLESDNLEKDRDLEKSLRRLHLLETKHELLRAKMADVTTNMTA